MTHESLGSQRLFAWWLVSLGFSGALAGRAQTPLGPEIRVNSVSDQIQSAPAVGCDRQSNCLVAWDSGRVTGDDQTFRLFGLSLSPLGEKLMERTLQEEFDFSYPEILGGEEGWTVAWNGSLAEPQKSPIFRSFDPALKARDSGWVVHPPAPMFGNLFAAGKSGAGFVFVGPGNDLTVDDPSCACEEGVFGLWIDTLGNAVLPPVRVNDDPSGTEGLANPNGGLAVDGREQAVFTFFRYRKGASGDADVFIRRFSPSGQPLGPDLRVNTFLPGAQLQPQVAAAPGGGFLVAWQSQDQDGDNDGIYARLFAEDGTPATGEIPVNTVTRSGQRAPKVAVDRFGNYAVIWSDFDPRLENHIVYDWEVKLRLFRADGSPVAGEYLVNQEHHFEQKASSVAFAPNGTLLVGWQSTALGSDDTLDEVAARRFSASPGAEPCAVSGSSILCDTGRTGGPAELRLTWGGRPGEVTLFGDWDGDGRDDVCAWFRGRFRCDLDHEGAPAEADLPFGLPTDVPLLGDIDGDGRAEACVHRRRRLLCDTRHDGGKPDFAINLGSGTETPLLGDLDGDGRDDLCLFEGGLWSCLVETRRLLIGFGAPLDRPALGDLNQDGRADLCVLRGDQLLCDTAHDGGIAEGLLTIEPLSGARPLFGNLDGL